MREENQEELEETCWDVSYNTLAKIGFAICLVLATYFIPYSKEEASKITIKELSNFAMSLSLLNFGLWGLAREGQNFFINIYQKENNESNKN